MVLRYGRILRRTIAKEIIIVDKSTSNLLEEGSIYLDIKWVYSLNMPSEEPI